MDDRTSTPPDRSSRDRRTRRRSRATAVIGALLLIGLLAVGAGLAPRLIGRLASPPASPTPEPEDRMAVEKLAVRRAQERAQLASYGWVDAEAGIARIPIDRAMVLLVDQGLPVGVPTLAASETAPVAPAIDPASVSFQENVLPIFVEHCSECHGEEDPEEGLQLTSYKSVMAGSFYGSVVKGGDVEGSYLAEMITSGQMPKRGDPLTSTETATILAWIEAGAPDN